jgi:hypothetical protein
MPAPSITLPPAMLQFAVSKTSVMTQVCTYIHLNQNKIDLALYYLVEKVARLVCSCEWESYTFDLYISFYASHY